MQHGELTEEEYYEIIPVIHQENPSSTSDNSKPNLGLNHLGKSSHSLHVNTSQVFQPMSRRWKRRILAYFEDDFNSPIGQAPLLPAEYPSQAVYSAKSPF